MAVRLVGVQHADAAFGGPIEQPYLRAFASFVILATENSVRLRDSVSPCKTRDHRALRYLLSEGAKFSAAPLMQ